MKKIKITAYFLGFALLAYCSGVFIVEKISAAEVTGWLWGGSEDSTMEGKTCTYGVDATDPACKDGNETGVGWINMDCGSKVDSNLNGSIDNDDVALKICNAGINIGKNCNGPEAVICTGGFCVDACTVRNYGVAIPDGSTGTLDGYAWSENLGWISFKETDLAGCPVAPCNARRNGDNLEGWARIMSIAQAASNAGGWQGWIKLSGNIQGGGTYGVNLNNMDGDKTTHAYAWSGGVTKPEPELGWIDFGQALFVQKKVIVCPDKYSLKVNDSHNFKAYYVDEDVTCSTLGAALEITDDAETTWSTTTSTKISVDNDLDKGKATALGGTGDNNYTADVNATYKGLTGTAVVCVSDGSCINETCQGATCSECGYDPIEGTKDCGGTDWQEVVN